MKSKYLITALIKAVPLIAIAILIWQWYNLKNIASPPSPLTSLGEKLADGITQNRIAPPTESWKVLRITDGDTITVVRGSQRERIRFCGVDADEVAHNGKPAQSIYANQAKNYLQQLINESGNQVAISMIEKDRYGRWVGEVWVNPGTDKEELANGLLVLKGLARIYPNYLSQCPNAQVLSTAEADAKAKKSGVWSNYHSIPPWEFRKQQRQNRGN